MADPDSSIPEGRRWALAKRTQWRIDRRCAKGWASQLCPDCLSATLLLSINSLFRLRLSAREVSEFGVG
jgi:hypothetical protein